MALTDIQIKQAKPKNEPYTLKDIQGLSLFVPTSGSKCWHFRFTFASKEGHISLGTYPQITLQIESLNSVIRHAIKKRKVFPTDESVRKVIYLAIQEASKKWNMPIRN